MRCPKCGYFSFDYLAECGKCGAGLSDVKEKLGLLGIKPNATFFLGSLLKDGGETVAASDDWGGPVPAAENNLSEIEFGEDFDLDLGLPSDGPPPLPKTPPADSSAEFALFDLGVPELEEESRGDRPASRGALPVMDTAASLSVEPTAARAIPPGGSGSSKAPVEDEPSEGLMFDLSAEDFDERPAGARDRGLETGPSPRPGVIGPAGGPIDTVGGTVAGSSDEMPHDLVLELDDEDLDVSPPPVGASAAIETSIPSVSAAVKEDGPLELSLDLEEEYPAAETPGAQGKEMEAAGEDLWRSGRPMPGQGGPSTKAEEELILEFDEEPANVDGGPAGPRTIEPDLLLKGKEPPVSMGGTVTRHAGPEAEASAPTDDMVIELTDDDLQILMTELEGISDKEAAKPGESPGTKPMAKKG